MRLLLLRDVTEKRRLEARLGDPVPPRITSRDTAMQAVLEKAEQVAPTDATVCLQGESDVGKGVVVRHVHHRSRRAGLAEEGEDRLKRCGKSPPATVTP